MSGCLVCDFLLYTNVVISGRYLDTEDGTAKRYICDALMILFQNLQNVASAKELNFQRVIEEHATVCPVFAPDIKFTRRLYFGVILEDREFNGKGTIACSLSVIEQIWDVEVLRPSKI